MKKNKMMRIAAVLLVVTLLSTCAISGTFAKYITTGEGAGSARVAKWGIEITMEDDLFDAEYATDDDNYTGEYSVVSADGTDVVAPGTFKDDAITATISGTPEVATRLYLDLTVTKDIGLEAGDYLDYTTGLDDADTFNLGEAYYPVKFDIAFSGTIADHPNMNFSISSLLARAGYPAAVSADGISLTELKKFIADNEGYFPVAGNTNTYGIGCDEDGRIYVDVPAGKTIDGTFTLSWAWAFEQVAMDDPTDNSSIYDKADTFLGMQDDQEIDFTFTAAAVQID